MKQRKRLYKNLAGMYLDVNKMEDSENLLVKQENNDLFVNKNEEKDHITIHTNQSTFYL